MIVKMIVSCVRVVGMEGGFVRIGVFMTSLYWVAGVEIHARTVVRVGM